MLKWLARLVTKRLFSANANNTILALQVLYVKDSGTFVAASIAFADRALLLGAIFATQLRRELAARSDVIGEAYVTSTPSNCIVILDRPMRSKGLLQVAIEAAAATLLLRIVNQQDVPFSGISDDMRHRIQRD